MSNSTRLAALLWIPTASMLAGAMTPPRGFAQAVQPAAFDTPGSSDRARIQKRLAAGHPARIIGQGWTQVVVSPQITPEGVEWIAPSSASQDSVPVRTMTHWADIDRIQTTGNSARPGALSGAIAGGLLALAVGASLQSDPILGGNSAGVLAATAGGALFGAGVGALIGLAIPRWVNVHVGNANR